MRSNFASSRAGERELDASGNVRESPGPLPEGADLHVPPAEAPDPARGRSPVSSRSQSVALDAEPHGSTPRIQFQGVLRGIGSVIAPATLVTALTFYFGWARTNSLAFYFGIDPRMFGFSVQDYVLRSVDAVFFPLALILLIALLALWLHSLIVTQLQRAERLPFLRRVAWAMAFLAFVLLTLGIVELARGLPFRTHYLFPPLTLGLGVAALAYSVYLQQRLADAASDQSEAGAGPPWLALASVTLVAILIVLSVFWAMAEYAQAVGRGRAQWLAQGLARLPGAVLYSKQRLLIGAAGITEEAIGDAGSLYGFRYTGLRLLLHSGGKYFLLPEQWTPANGVAVVLPDRDDLRLEFTPGVQ